MTFNENIETDYTVDGNVKVEASFNEEVIDNPGEHIIELPIEVDNQITVNIKPSNVKATITKKGAFDSADDNPHFITWDVLFNQNYDTLTGVKLVDDMPKSLSIEKIEVYDVELNHDGTFKSLKRALDQSEYTLEGNSIIFHNTLKTPHLIRYESKILDEYIPETGGNLKFENTAKIYSNEISEAGIEAKTTLTAKYGKLLEKNLLHYDDVSQSFTWEVKYNYGEKRIENALIEDVFDEGLEFVEESFKIFNKQGEEVIVDYTLSIDNNKLSIQFNDVIEDAYIIQYETKLKDQYVLNENKRYENKVTSGKAEDVAGGTVRQGLVNKTTPNINYQEKQIEWVININRNNYEMTNYVLTDTYVNRGLELDLNSFKIMNKTTNKVLTDEEYTLTINKEGNEELGFTLSFTEETTTDSFTVSFKTDYDVNKITDEDEVFINNARLQWVDQYGNQQENSSEAYRYVNNESINNGRKFGKYNAVTKEITWQVDVNYNSDKTNNARLKDRINERQNFVKDSLEIYRYSVNSSGHITQEERLDLDQFQIDYPNETNDFVLSIEFPDDSNTKYSVVFRTSIENNEIRNLYKNRAVFENGKLSKTLDASVSVANGSKFISKSGVQSSDYVDWTVRINESQSTIKNATLVDEPSMSQILLEDTIKVYPVTVQENERYTVDYDHPLILDEDYSLEIVRDATSQQFVLKFLDVIDRTYVLEYTSQISLDVDEKDISNRVKLFGTELSKTNTEDTTTISIDIHKTSGNARGKKGSFKVKKVDTQGRPLEGVRFELYNKFNRKMTSVITNELGEFEYHNLVYGTYTLYETEALKGYVISDALKEGVIIKIDDDHNDLNQELVFENRMNEVLINKVDADNNSLEGARFELLKRTDDDYVVEKPEFTVEEAGKIFYGLDAGQYRLRELSAPEGYLVNTIPFDFQIKVNEHDQERDVSVDFVNYKGSVQLNKVGFEDEALSGVTFNLYTDTHHLVYESLVTDENGIIDLENKLAPGTYYFKEIKSTQGHIVNETPLYFTIANKAEGIPEYVYVKATNEKGSVIFDKVSEWGTPLSDVSFTLYNSLDEEVTTVITDAQGRVRVDQLDAGDYYFLETETLSQYILNTERISFTIPEKAKTENVVVQLEKFVNYQGGVQIEKIDEHGNLLDHARFKIVDEHNKVVKKVSAVDGIVKIERLQPGHYKIIEVEAPKGYVLSNQEFEFEIPERYEGQYDVETIKIVNEKEPEKERTPKTGLSHNNFIYIVIIFTSISFLLVLKKRKKNHR